MRASSFFSLDEGISTVSWAAMIPLRIRVRKSAMGSVMLMPLPARLGHARDVALVRHLPQADAAQAELLVDGARTAALAAARVRPGLVLRRARRTHDLGGLCHEFLSRFLRPRRPGRSRTRSRPDVPRGRTACPAHPVARRPRRRSARRW